MSRTVAEHKNSIQTASVLTSMKYLKKNLRHIYFGEAVS